MMLPLLDESSKGEVSADLRMAPPVILLLLLLLLLLSSPWVVVESFGSCFTLVKQHWSLLLLPLVWLTFDVVFWSSLEVEPLQLGLKLSVGLVLVSWLGDPFGLIVEMVERGGEPPETPMRQLGGDCNDDKSVLEVEPDELCDELGDEVGLLRLVLVVGECCCCCCC